MSDCTLQARDATVLTIDLDRRRTSRTVLIPIPVVLVLLFPVAWLKAFSNYLQYMAWSRMETDDVLLDKFIAVLIAPFSPKLPRDTLLGGVSHYLSTLPAQDLPQLVQAICSSPHLWTTEDRRRRSREAIRLGCIGAINRLRAEPESSSWWRWKIDKANAWMNDLSQVIQNEEHTHPNATAQFKIAMLYASPLANDQQRQASATWNGTARTRVEEEVVVHLAERLPSATIEDVDVQRLKKDSETMDILGEVADSISDERLGVLDLPSIVAEAQTLLFNGLAVRSARLDASGTATTASVSHLARLIARIIHVMGLGGKANTQDSMERFLSFCSTMQKLAKNLPPLASGDRTRDSPSPPKLDVWEMHKQALFSFVLPALSMLRILVNLEPGDILSAPPTLQKDTASHPIPSAIAIQTLLTLSCFAEIIGQTQGGMDGYEKLVSGMLDVLVATGGSTGTQMLFSHIGNPDELSDAQATWLMMTGESLVRWIDSYTLSSRLTPLIDKHIQGDSLRGSFEAAHSLQIAIVVAAGECADADINAGSRGEVLGRMSEDVEKAVAYCDLLVHQRSTETLNDEQFRAAYPTVVQAISRLCPDRVQPVLRLLHPPRAQKLREAIKQSCRLAFVSCTPFIRRVDLPRHMEQIATDIVESEEGSGQRDELVSAAFRMVMTDLGDSERRVGMRWWSEWRDVFEKNRLDGARQRARL